MTWRGIWLAAVVLLNAGLLTYVAIVSEAGRFDYGDSRRRIDPEERHQTMISRIDDADLIHYMDRLFRTEQLARAEARDQRSRREFVHRWAFSLAFLNLTFFVIAIYGPPRLSAATRKKSAEQTSDGNAEKPPGVERKL